MRATEQLRQMLDELGVEWVDTGDGSTLIPEQAATNVAWDVNVWPSGKDMGDCLWVQNRLQTSDGQSCYATQANYEHCKYSTDRGWRDTSKYAELFGTPERAAKTVSAMCSHGIWSCDGCPLFDEGVEHCESELGDTPSLLDWLRGDA